MSVRIVLLLSVLLAVPLGCTSILNAGEIHYAVAEGDLQLVTTLVGGHNRLNDRDENGNTALNPAIGLSQSNIAEYLIEHGADIGGADAEDQSPLHTAASKKNLQITKRPLEKGAKTINDTTRAEHVGFMGNWKPLHLACLKGYPEIVELPLDYGANIEARDGVERTPFDYHS